MKRDIRHLFNTEDVKTELPENHRAEFLEKLKASQSEVKSQSLPFWLKIAAILIVTVTVGYVILNEKSVVNETIPLQDQIAAIEMQYKQDISQEWTNFLTLTDDEVLVERFRTKLNDLDDDYTLLSKQFQSDSNNVLIIEQLVNNLQTRLKILKDIQSQIKLIQQKTEQHENNI